MDDGTPTRTIIDLTHHDGTPHKDYNRFDTPPHTLLNLLLKRIDYLASSTKSKLPTIAIHLPYNLGEYINDVRCVHHVEGSIFEMQKEKNV